MSLLLVFHDRKRSIVCSDDRSTFYDEQGQRQARDEQVPKFQIVEAVPSREKFIVGGCGRRDILELLMNGTARMAASRNLNLVELSKILPSFLQKAFAERKAIQVPPDRDKVDLALIGYDHAACRIRAWVLRCSADSFVEIETTGNPANRIFGLGAFDVGDTPQLRVLTQHMKLAPHRHGNWVCSQLRDAANELSHRYPEAIGRASFYAGLDGVGLIPLANEFVAPPKKFSARGRSGVIGRSFGSATAGRLFLGSIRTPDYGGPDSYGNADGGVGTQGGAMTACT